MKNELKLELRANIYQINLKQNYHSSEHQEDPETTDTYFGTGVDDILSWNKQIEIRANKLSRTNSILSNKDIIFPKSFKMIFSTVFF